MADSPVRDAFKRQKEHVMTEFEQRSSQVFLQLNEQGLNVALYWKNTGGCRGFVVIGSGFWGPALVGCCRCGCE